MNSHIFGMQTDAQSAYKPFWLQYTKTREIFHQGFFQFWNDIYSSNFVITITHQKKVMISEDMITGVPHCLHSENFNSSQTQQAF